MRWRRAARRGEKYIDGTEFPPHVEHRVLRHYPQLEKGDWPEVERGLREWFICSAWRGRTVLGMPSRIVDEAWHEFILDSIAYTRFCNAAFGGYLHHTPDEGMSTPMGSALGNTILAWDRSAAGSERESVLWDLDERLGIPEPLGVSGVDLSAVRAGGQPVYVGGGGCGAAIGDGAGDGGGGGGCGGGGCGGGGGGS